MKAMLKAGGYRSPAYQLSRAKEEHIVRGFAWDDQLALAVRKTTASITRGMGPGRQSSPLDLSGAVACSRDLPWFPVGKDLIVDGSFFSVQETKLSLALRQHVTIDEPRRVSSLFPYSKTDAKVLGVRFGALQNVCFSRTLGSLFTVGCRVRSYAGSRRSTSLPGHRRKAGEQKHGGDAHRTCCGGVGPPYHVANGATRCVFRRPKSQHDLTCPYR